LYHGFGTLTQADGTKLMGQFRNGEFVGDRRKSIAAIPMNLSSIRTPVQQRNKQQLFQSAPVHAFSPYKKQTSPKEQTPNTSQQSVGTTKGGYDFVLHSPRGLTPVVPPLNLSKTQL